MMNVVSLSEFKELKEIQVSEKSYCLYLQTLANSQLETEVNVLLDDFSADKYGKDFFAKGQLILKEIAQRAESPVNLKIHNLNQETLKLL